MERRVPFRVVTTKLKAVIVHDSNPKPRMDARIDFLVEALTFQTRPQ